MVVMEVEALRFAASRALAHSIERWSGQREAVGVNSALREAVSCDMLCDGDPLVFVGVAELSSEKLFCVAASVTDGEADATLELKAGVRL